MAEIEDDEVEILVHISAPSKGTDDAAYRAFATAYLEFQPVKIHKHLDRLSKVPFGSSFQGLGNQGHNSWIDSGNKSDISTNYPSSFQRPTTLVERTPSSFKSPDASFKSISDNLNTPRFYDSTAGQPSRIYQPSPSSENADNSLPPLDVVPDTLLQISKFVATTSSPTARFQTHLDRKAPTSFSDSHDPSTTEVFEYMLAMEASPANTRNSDEQPVSSLDLPTLLQKRPRLDAHEEHPKSGDLQLPTSSPIIFQLSSIPSSIAVPQQVKKRKLAPELLEQPQKRQRFNESAKVSQESSKIVPKQKSFASSIKQSNPNEIRPSLPNSAVHLGPSDIITPLLVEVVQSGICKFWRRRDFAIRELRPLERGYWLVNYSIWDAEVRKHAWAFLQGYIGKGLCGWGVSCIKNPEATQLRIYCWGMIVKHIYFFLRLIGKGKVKETGATWFDGDGIATVVVPPISNDLEQTSAAGLD